MKFMVRIDIVVPMCEKPNSMNRWCRWVLSGWNGDFLFRIRVVITLTVSNTGIDNIANVNGTSPMPSSANFAHAVSLFRMLITNIDIIVPMTSVPPSPMNIFVELPNTLCRKNGIMAPAAEMAIIVIDVLPDL